MLHNDAIEFPIGQKLGIDIQIKSLECSECTLQIWPFWIILVPKWPQMAISDTQANLRCLKMVLLDYVAAHVYKTLIRGCDAFQQHRLH